MKRTPEFYKFAKKVKDKTIVCDCKGWQKSYRGIYEAFLSSKHQVSYRGIYEAFLSSKHQILPFKHCPYCGKEINAEETKVYVELD